MPRRFNIETLERRQMYAAHSIVDYIDDDVVSVAAGDVNGDGAADVALLASHSIKSPRDSASGQIVGSDHPWGSHFLGGDPSQPVIVGLVGDFNGDGRDDVAEFFPGAVYDLLVNSFTRSGGETVPSEQFSLNFTKIEFKAAATNGDDLVGWNASGAVNFESQTRPHADGILIGMLLPYMEQDNVYNAGNGLGVDVWEHANLQGGPQTNGIIAVLIGLMQDVTDGTSNTMMLTVDPSDASGNAVSSGILASDEFFARFANTTFDDEAVPVAGRLSKASQITHDSEFENWASVSRFDRRYLPLVGNSILHEDNEFSFPRMIRTR